MIEISESYKVHIVILTWNNSKILKRCLESIENVDHKNFTISVIDNNSSDDSLKMISQNFPNVQTIKNSKNFKFGRGYNEGLKKINVEDNDFIILLNDDTIVSRNFIDELINPLVKDQKAIISTPKILYSSNINKIWYAGGDCRFMERFNLSYWNKRF
tara:strand:- start:531 stop:1004 length:474 start_codon:yes stop_codon:yes gene_type:complete